MIFIDLFCHYCQHQKMLFFELLCYPTRRISNRYIIFVNTSIWLIFFLFCLIIFFFYKSLYCPDITKWNFYLFIKDCTETRSCRFHNTIILQEGIDCSSYYVHNIVIVTILLQAWGKIVSHAKEVLFEIEDFFLKLLFSESFPVSCSVLIFSLPLLCLFVFYKTKEFVILNLNFVSMHYRP